VVLVDVLEEVLVLVEVLEEVLVLAEVLEEVLVEELLRNFFKKLFTIKIFDT
jgi:hypothetical protein